MFPVTLILQRVQREHHSVIARIYNSSYIYATYIYLRLWPRCSRNIIRFVHRLIMKMNTLIVQRSRAKYSFAIVSLAMPVHSESRSDPFRKFLLERTATN